MKPIAVLFSLVSILSLSACNSNPLEDFVSRNVEIESTKGGDWVGHLDFEHTQYFESSRRVCDTAVCGYDSEYRCDTHYVCFDVNHSEVCRGSTHTCTAPRNSHPIHHCEPINDCGYVQIPRYCDVNCRDVPFIDSYTKTATSVVQASIHDRNGAVVAAKNIENLWLGVMTNDRFRRAIDDPSLRPGDYSDLFKQLSKADNTVLVLNAKGYRLVSGQSFLKLPADFKAGDPAHVELVVEATGTDKTATSVLGTAEDFPALETSSGPN